MLGLLLLFVWLLYLTEIAYFNGTREMGAWRQEVPSSIRDNGEAKSTWIH